MRQLTSISEVEMKRGGVTSGKVTSSHDLASLTRTCSSSFANWHCTHNPMAIRILSEAHLITNNSKLSPLCWRT